MDTDLYIAAMKCKRAVISRNLGYIKMLWDNDRSWATIDVFRRIVEIANYPSGITVYTNKDVSVQVLEKMIAIIKTRAKIENRR